MRQRARRARCARSGPEFCFARIRRSLPRPPPLRSSRARYAYFFGLCVHKLAHFFDVVHGTRHDFFMSEYRANYHLRWVQLLLSRGFDPASVERECREMVWQVVD